MTPSLQVKVLRVLETGDILPVGADRPSRVDVRCLSATNKDLGALQQAGTFREDLYWRIKGVEVHLPPLRERAADLPLLARHFLNQCAHLCPDGRARQLSDAATEALLAHPWPGNLRELRHEMQRASVLAGERREHPARGPVLHRERSSARARPGRHHAPAEGGGPGAPGD